MLPSFLQREYLIFIGLLTLSNIFMTFAWYGHLKFKHYSIFLVILISWLIAFFEYCLQVPANRMGSQILSASQLKLTQEVITFLVFFIFSVFYLGQKPDRNDFLAFVMIVLALWISLSKPLGSS